ncbi:MAG: dockerin type I repeat-containing protein [Clostridia bacterium]|nr:dockerin type I repeat-containing protein [Clostridia bacterium]
MNRSFKRFVSLLLAVITALSCVAVSYAADVMYGDVTSDGKINSSDALAILQHSVGLSQISDENIAAADVSADMKLNSSDALLILQYAVGIITSFPAEEAGDDKNEEDKNPAPETKEEILALYANAINGARETIPAYKLNMKTKAIDVKFSGSAMSMVPKDELETMKKDMMKESSFQNTFRAGSASALANLPGECKITDPSLFKDITLTVLPDGNYQIDIIFKDDKNPKAGSPIVTMLQLPDKTTFIKEMEEELGTATGGEDIQASVEVNAMEYLNCKISCVVDSESGQIVSMKTESDMRSDVTTYVLFFSMGTDTTTRTVNEYSNFAN